MKKTKQHKPQPSPEVTVKDAAKIIGVTVRTIHDWIQQGKLTVIRETPIYHGPKFLDRAQVEAIATERTRGS